MARYAEADCRHCRREGIKLYLKGSKCETPKCPIEKRPIPPGQHGRRRAGKASPYLERLREKQKARRIYGVLEKQFRGYYGVAARQKGATGENLLRILERRLDNVVYRAGFAHSRDDARQLVLHRHVLVNGRLTNIPSFLCRPGDVVSVKEKSRGIVRVQEATERAQSRTVPSWVSADYSRMEAKVTSLPERGEIDVPVKESFIVEFYSR
ncbi:MAG TPA: 30S ribosomal protein S4 [Actinomycetota bacterium]|nr:30S ribosomal protein S4 [Actinomycetota bacterium]